ncbi:MAG: O-antigen ligase family protein [Verrucomicrobiales bacterium]|nr:O-antigen ligase family protein [Verrucomicrobiales bacterium]
MLSSSKNLDPPQSSKTATFAVGAAALTALIVCFFGGKGLLTLTLVSTVSGIVWLISPPNHLPSRSLLLGALVLVAVAFSGLLPSSWFGGEELWRSKLSSSWGIPIPSTVSPQPELSLGAALTLTLFCIWFFLLAGQNAGEHQRRLVLRALGIGIAAISGLAILQKLGWINLGWPYSPHKPTGEDMGPFPNRNHFSTLCAIGSILCAANAYDSYRRKELSWPLFAIGAIVPFSAIVLNSSRAGLLLYFVGSIAWIATSGMKSHIFKKIALSSTLILGSAAVIILYGSGSGARLASSDLSAQSLQNEGRFSVYSETIRLGLDSPWLGVGLGNFDAVFGLQHQLNQPLSRYIHPESDWLWLWFEGGLLCILPLVVGVAIWFGLCAGKARGESKSKRGRSDRKLRTVCIVVVFMAVAHSIIDVPLHNPGLATLVLVLASLGLKPTADSRTVAPPQRWAIRTFSLVPIAAAIALSLSHLGHPLYPGRIAMEVGQKEVSEFLSSNKLRDASKRLDELIEQYPLQWSLYFQRASLDLALREPTESAMMDFGRARALEPHNSTLCFEEGKLWLEYEPRLAIVPWRAYFERTENAEFFGIMLNLSRNHDPLHRDLLSLARTPEMMLRALSLAAPGDWSSGLERLLKKDPTLEHLNPTHRQQLFSLWSQRGNKDQLISELESHPDWQKDGWQIMVEHFANNSEFDRAWEIQKKFASVPSPGQSSSVTDLQQMERNFLYNPTDPRRGIDLFYAQKTAGKWDEAILTLEKTMQLPNAPDYLIQELAALHAERGEFRLAYDTMKKIYSPQ